jgi:hypothetical protein
MASAFGTAIFGAILISRLAVHLHELLPASAAAHVTTKNIQQSTSVLHRLPPDITHKILEAFALSFHDVFLWTVPLAALTFVVALFLRETPLKESTADIAEGASLQLQHEDK